VRSLAPELNGPVTLEDAALITFLILEKEPESYPAAARRLIARLATESDLALDDLSEAAGILAQLEWEPDQARSELLDLIRP
jgi:hypothetical protein